MVRAVFRVHPAAPAWPRHPAVDDDDPHVEADWTATVRLAARDVAALGHVALPFPPGDPIYGFIAGSGQARLPSLGSLLLRGENDALTVSLASLPRRRSTRSGR